MLNRKRQNDPTGIIMKHLKGSYREDALPPLSLQMQLSVLLCSSSVAYLQTVFFSFFLLGILLELSSGLPLLYDETSHLKKIETESVKVVGPWPALHVSMNKV